jgi:hypothetical protein
MLMSDVLAIRRRELRVRRMPAVGWDVPEGHADEPSETAGRAALAARYLAHALAHDAVTAGWIRRHRLTGHASQFSFWSPDVCVENLRAAISRTNLRPAPESLDSLVAVQLAQARTQLDNPVLLAFRAVDTAAWGISLEGALGDRRTLAHACRNGFSDYLARWTAKGRLIDASAVVNNARAPSDDEPGWRGGVELVDRPGEQCRVTVQFRLTSEIDNVACAAVLAQVLDGTEGMLFRWLRIEAGVAYGTVAVAKDDDGRPRTLIIGASVLRDQLPAAIDAMRLCVDRIDKGELPAEALGLATIRVVDRVLTKLDEPFGALDDYRRRLNEQPSMSAIAEGAPAAPEKLSRIPRLSHSHQSAVAYVGALDDAVPGLLGRLR